MGPPRGQSERYGKIRFAVLQSIANLDPDAGMSAGAVLSGALSLAGLPSTPEVQEEALTVWFDLFRTGVISFGRSFIENDVVWCHLTDRGKQAVGNLSRDPHNPLGYIAAIESCVGHNAVAMNYISEGVAVFNSGHHRAAAVMIGIATEVLLYDLADAICGLYEMAGKAHPKDLKGYNIKPVIDAVERVLLMQKKGMSKQLLDRFESVWRYIQPVRLLRNATGHPVEVEGVTVEAVHGNYIFFHDIAKLLHDLRAWAISNYRVSP